jgi:hypothetical protein
MHTCGQGVNWQYNEEVNRCSDEEKRDHGINEIANRKFATVDRKHNALSSEWTGT